MVLVTLNPILLNIRSHGIKIFQSRYLRCKPEKIQPKYTENFENPLKIFWGEDTHFDLIIKGLFQNFEII